jgi:hypothetical protein
MSLFASGSGLEKANHPQTGNARPDNLRFRSYRDLLKKRE